MNDRILVGQESLKTAVSNLSRVAIACQGGGSHAAYVAGALVPLLSQFSQKSALGGPQQLVALSGTSGGAICALLAWWGLLMGGPDRAIERLQIFWEKNSAQRPLEAWWNTAAVSALQLQPCETQWSPYGPPLREAVAATTQLWPKIAGWFGEMIRPDFFQMEHSLREVLQINSLVDFDETVEAIAGLCGVPADVQNWHACSLAADIGAHGGPVFKQPAPTPAHDFAAIIGRIDRSLGTLARVEAALGSQGWLADAYRQVMTRLDGDDPAYAGRPYQELKALSLPSYGSGDEVLDELEQLLEPFITRIPRLILGAVEMDTGNFQAFRSDRLSGQGGISLEAVLASAAIPSLFKAVRTMGADGLEHHYLDGLFSENPPIAPLIAPTGATSLGFKGKPDEIWVIQVNPKRCEILDKSPGNPFGASPSQFDLADRRNELSGNLSLLQEGNFIDAINRVVEDGNQCEESRYQKVQLFTIPLDDQAARKLSSRVLDYASKLCRDRRLKNALVDHGNAQARKFFPVREFIVECLGQGDAARRMAYFNRQPENSSLAALQPVVDSLHRTFGSTFHVFIEEVAIGDHPACNCRKGRHWDVTVHWRALGMTSTSSGPSRRASLKGFAHFTLAETASQGGASPLFHLQSGVLEDIYISEAEYGNSQSSVNTCWGHSRQGSKATTP